MMIRNDRLMDPQKAMDARNDAHRAAVSARKDWEATDCTDNALEHEFNRRVEEYRRIRDQAANGTLQTW